MTSSAKLQAKQAPGLVINAPEFFKDEAFVAWLNNSETVVFTWHRGGAPGPWSDVIVLVDPSFNGEGSDSDMPEHIWNTVIVECRKHFFSFPRGCEHIHVRLTNN